MIVRRSYRVVGGGPGAASPRSPGLVTSPRYSPTSQGYRVVRNPAHPSATQTMPADLADLGGALARGPRAPFTPGSDGSSFDPGDPGGLLGQLGFQEPSFGGIDANGMPYSNIYDPVRGGTLAGALLSQSGAGRALQQEIGAHHGGGFGEQSWGQLWGAGGHFAGRGTGRQWSGDPNDPGGGSGGTGGMSGGGGHKGTSGSGQPLPEPGPARSGEGADVGEYWAANIALGLAIGATLGPLAALAYEATYYVADSPTEDFDPYQWVEGAGSSTSNTSISSYPEVDQRGGSLSPLEAARVMAFLRNALVLGGRLHGEWRQGEGGADSPSGGADSPSGGAGGATPLGKRVILGGRTYSSDWVAGRNR